MRGPRGEHLRLDLVTMLKPNDIAPDFSLTAAQGHQVTLRQLLEAGPVVIYFYPSDFTPVCTKQACMFRDAFDGLRRAGVQVVGISSQSASTHEKFRAKHELPFDLLSDAGRKVARAYGATSLLGLIPRRISYLVDRDRKIVDAAGGDFGLDSHRYFIDRVVAWRRAAERKEKLARGSGR